MKKYSLPPGLAMSVITLLSLVLWVAIWEALAR